MVHTQIEKPIVTYTDRQRQTQNAKIPVARETPTNREREKTREFRLFTLSER